jgi:hypothetical protein
MSNTGCTTILADVINPDAEDLANEIREIRDTSRFFEFFQGKMKLDLFFERRHHHQLSRSE